MSNEDDDVQRNDEHEEPTKQFRPHNLSLVVGDSGSESSIDNLQDMRSRMQSFAINVDDGGMPPTIFVEDSDVILPSTSQSAFGQSELASTLPKNHVDETGIDMDNFVKEFFANDTRFMHTAGRETETNFIEEIFTEKPPKILRDYLFGIVIGEGSYSKVKEVLHIRSLKRRAVKIIKDKRLRKIPGGEQNVQREIEVLQRLSHPNVVKVVEIFRIEEKQKLYIVMEFCVCSLQQMLDNCVEKVLPEFQCHLYFTQLLDGLDFLHSKRIIHKDIKPGNLLLSLDGILKICDLGVAELLSPDSKSDWCTLVQGTPKFQPPEIVSGTQRRFRGSLVDIWACGVTLYNMVSGEYPFDGDVIMKLFENITNCPLKMPSNLKLSAELERLLQGMLQKDPERRWNTLRIRACKWFSGQHQIDDARIVHVPPVKDIPAHRPLGVFHCLEQLYGARDDEVDEHYKEARFDKEISTAPLSAFNQQHPFRSRQSMDFVALDDGQMKMAEEERTPILENAERNNCDQANNPQSSNVRRNAGNSGCEEEEEEMRRRRRKISVARLRQIIFIAFCFLIVVATVLVLILML